MNGTAKDHPAWVGALSATELRAIADTTTDQRTRVEALAELKRRGVTPMSMNEYDRQTIKYLRATGTSETLIDRVDRAVEWASRAEAELRDLQQQLAAAQAQTKLLAAELIERGAPR